LTVVTCSCWVIRMKRSAMHSWVLSLFLFIKDGSFTCVFIEDDTFVIVLRVIHSSSAFNFQSACVRWRLRCLEVLKVCLVRWPFRWLHKTLLFSPPGVDEPICAVYLALDQTIFIPFQISSTAWPPFYPRGSSLLNLIQEKIDKNDQAINLSLCRLYCYSKWKVLQNAYV